MSFWSGLANRAKQKFQQTEDFVKQNPTPFSFAKKQIQPIQQQVQQTFRPATNFFRQNPSPASFVNKTVVRPAVNQVKTNFQQSPIMRDVIKPVQQFAQKPVMPKFQVKPLNPNTSGYKVDQLVQNKVVNPIKAGVNTWNNSESFLNKIPIKNQFANKLGINSVGSLIGSDNLTPIQRMAKIKAEPDYTGEMAKGMAMNFMGGTGNKTSLQKIAPEIAKTKNAMAIKAMAKQAGLDVSKLGKSFLKELVNEQDVQKTTELLKNLMPAAKKAVAQKIALQSTRDAVSEAGTNQEVGNILNRQTTSQGLSQPEMPQAGVQTATIRNTANPRVDTASPNFSLDSNLPEMNGNKKRGLTQSVEATNNISGETKTQVAGTYNPKTNKTLMGEAEALLNDGVTIDFKNTKGLDKKVAATIQEAINLDSNGNAEAAANLYNNLSEHATELGRGVQAFSLLQKMSPEAVSLSVAGRIKKFNATHSAQIPELSGEQVKIISDKVKQVMSFSEGREKNIAMNELDNIINDFIPSSFVDKATTVWKAGLLTSLRTHERNLVGNLMHGTAEVLKDVPAVGADAMMSQVTGKRSMSLSFRGIGEFGSKNTRQQMGDILSKGYDPGEQVNKFDYKRVTWAKTPVQQFLKKTTDAVFRTLGVADKPFYNAAFARSLYDQAGAEAINQGIRGNTKFIEELVAKPTEEMLKNAIIDANVATFKNKNVASQVAVTIKKALKDSGQTYGKDFGRELGKLAGEMTMPFTGVPSSVIGQTIAYSPAGLVKGIFNTGKVMVKNMPELQRQAAQEVGRGVIGTGIFSLGAYLAGKGLITGQPKDAAEARQWDLENKPRNSINIAGRWYSLNSISPEAIVTLAGAKLNEEKQNGKSIADYGVSLVKDQLDQSFLTGLQAPVNAITDPKRYAKSYIGSTLSSMVEPNILKDVSKAFDKTQRETNTVFDYVKAGIPGVRNTLVAKRDALGNQMKQEPSGLWSFVDLFNSKTPVNDSVVNELSRLNIAGENATPSKLTANQSVYGQKLKLTPQELDALEEQSGGAVREVLNSVVSSPSYQDLSDADKADMIQNAVKDARKSVKEDAVSGMGGFNSANVADKYAKQLEKDQFDKSGEKSAIINGTYYYKDKNGDPKSMSKVEYDNSIRDLELTYYKKNKDYTNWTKLAEEKKKQIEEDFKTADELTKAKLQNEYDTLLGDMAKFAGYGGFTKGKKAKKINVSTSTPKVSSTVPIKISKPQRIAIKQPSTPKLARIKNISGSYLRNLK